MTNLTKEQLLEKDEAGLQDIAQQLNVKDIEGKSKENLIYDILDAQAEQTAGNETPVNGVHASLKGTRPTTYSQRTSLRPKAPRAMLRRLRRQKNKLRKRQMKMPNPRL